MSTAILTYGPDVDFRATPVDPVAVLRYAGTGAEQRATLQDLSRMQFVWPMRLTDSERTAVEAFFEARRQIAEAFYVKHPKSGQHARTGVSLGNSVASQVDFTLPTSGENSRDYPIDDSNVVVYDDGSPVTVSSVDVDARTFTLAAAPAAGSVMTCDYHAYRLVRLVAPFDFVGLGPNYSEGIAELLEVAE